MRKAETHTAQRVRRKQPGRPPKAESDRRSISIDVRVSRADLKIIRGLADRAGLPLRTYVRTAALRQRIRPAVPANAFAMAAELHRVSVNVDQAVRRLHENGQLNSADREVLRDLRYRLNQLALASIGEKADQ